MSFIANSTVINKYFESSGHISCQIKKQKYFIKDGWVTYQISKNPILKCQCCSENVLCNHMVYVLYKIHGIDLEYLKFFHKINVYISDILTTSPNINEDIISIIKDHIIDDTCGICLDPMNVKSFIDQTLFECPKCKKYAHSKCIHKWNLKKKIKECIYCRS